MTTKTAAVTDADAEFARSKGFITGRECGYSMENLWVSPSGKVHVYPAGDHRRLKWVSACFGPGANVPYAHHSSPSFRSAINYYND